MPLPLDVLEAEVLSLAPIDRMHLLDRLIATVEADPEIAKAWAVEARRRDSEIESGKVALIPGNDVLSRLRATLR
jgi:hypothetical protein